MSMIAQHPGKCIDHEFQDRTYGRGFRVMNPVMTKGKLTGARCTVCCPPKVTGQKRGGVFNLEELKVK
jgi:hypothetical protein